MNIVPYQIGLAIQFIVQPHSAEADTENMVPFTNGYQIIQFIV